MPASRQVFLLILLACIALLGQSWAAEPKAKSAAGEITAIDTAKLTITIKDAKGGEVTAKVPAGTFISIDKQPSSLSDLKVGDKLTYTVKDGDTSSLVIRRNGKPGKK
ncbi:MAG: copper-binding protein [Planctomycetes bacterium]|nr:copper-binding protein [Planctomycetota bacterium]